MSLSPLSAVVLVNNSTYFEISLNARDFLRGASDNVNSIPLSNLSVTGQATIEINVHSTSEMGRV